MNARFRLGSWTVDARLGEFSRPDTPPVRVRAKVMDLLVYFAQHAGEVLTKDDLLNGVWQSEAISESALTRTIAELRQALGDDAEHPVFLETIPKRGYRLIAPVTPPGGLDPIAGVQPAVTEAAEQSTRRAAVLGWPRARFVAAVLLAGISGAVIWQSLASRTTDPQEPLRFAPREWVLVTAFDNRTGRPGFDGTLEHALEHELSNSAYVNVAPRERIEDALRLMVKPATTRVDTTIGREVALRDGGIRLVIAGTIDHLGASTR